MPPILTIRPACERFPGQWSNLFSKVLLDPLDHGPVDVLINNAGYGHEGVLEESPIEKMRRQFDVNVFGAVTAAKAFLPRFREPRRGVIVNVTSMGGMITMPGIAYYCGGKFALQGISEAMRSEMAPFGVHVTTLCPAHSGQTGRGAPWSAQSGRLGITTAFLIRTAKRVRP